MKTLLLSVLCLLSSRVMLAQLAPTDEQAIRQVINHWDANLNNHRFQEMNTYTTKDISFVTPIGIFWRGQQQVVQGHMNLFTAMYKNVPFKPSDMTVRAVTPDVAIVTEYMLIGASYPPDGNRAATKIEPWRALETMTLVKKNGHWLVAAGEVTPVNEKAIKSAGPKVASAKVGMK